MADGFNRVVGGEGGECVRTMPLAESRAMAALSEAVAEAGAVARAAPSKEN